MSQLILGLLFFFICITSENLFSIHCAKIATTKTKPVDDIRAKMQKAVPWHCSPSWYSDQNSSFTMYLNVYHAMMKRSLCPDIFTWFFFICMSLALYLLYSKSINLNQLLFACKKILWVSLELHQCKYYFLL